LETYETPGSKTSHLRQCQIIGNIRDTKLPVFLTWFYQLMITFSLLLLLGAHWQKKILSEKIKQVVLTCAAAGDGVSNCDTLEVELFCTCNAVGLT
jgi:hypothetical protein